MSSSHNSPAASNHHPYIPQGLSYRTHSSSQNRPHQNFNSNSYNYDYSQEDERAGAEDDGSKKQCSLVHSYENAYPQGLKSVPNAVELKVSEATVNTCGRACCQLGPDKCQYVWIVGSKCMAVSCPPSKKDLCEPVEL